MKNQFFKYIKILGILWLYNMGLLSGNTAQSYQLHYLKKFLTLLSHFLFFTVSLAKASTFHNSFWLYKFTSLSRKPHDLQFPPPFFPSLFLKMRIFIKIISFQIKKENKNETKKKYSSRWKNKKRLSWNNLFFFPMHEIYWKHNII